MRKSESANVDFPAWNIRLGLAHVNTTLTRPRSPNLISLLATQRSYQNADVPRQFSLMG